MLTKANFGECARTKLYFHEDIETSTNVATGKKIIIIFFMFAKTNIL